MSTKKLSAGDDIEARCTRCRMITNHIIIAMVEDEVVKVQCHTCGGAHKYHKPKPEKVAKPKAAKTTARKSTKPAPGEQWEDLCAGLDPAAARPYDMAGSFKAKALINHPTFGLGVVVQLCPPNKIEVMFKEGVKLLRCKL